jgi:hypothetical protein
MNIWKHFTKRFRLNFTLDTPGTTAFKQGYHNRELVLPVRAHTSYATECNH